MKRITLENGQPPKMEGDITVAEFLALLEAANRWVMGAQLNAQVNEEPKEPAKQDGE